MCLELDLVLWHEELELECKLYLAQCWCAHLMKRSNPNWRERELEGNANWRETQIGGKRKLYL